MFMNDADFVEEGRAGGPAYEQQQAGGARGYGPPRPPSAFSANAYDGADVLENDDDQAAAGGALSAAARARIEQQRQRAAQQRRERALASTNVVSRNDAPAVGLGAGGGSGFARPVSAAGFGARPGSAAGMTPVWERPSSAAPVPPTRRELLQEMAARDAERGGVARFQPHPPPRPDAAGGAAGWSDPTRGAARGAEAVEAEMKRKFGVDSVFDPTGGAAGAGRAPPAGLPPPVPQRPGKIVYTTANTDISDIRRFLMEPGPRNGPILCHIRREKGKLGYPYYALYLEAAGVQPGSDEGERFLLSARKRKKSKTSNYLISIDLEDTHRKSGNYFGKLRSNFVGTEFTIYDRGVKPSEAETTTGSSALAARCELGAVLYQYNVLGTRGPRKMTAIVPQVSDRNERVEFRPRTDRDKDAILRMHKERSDTRDELVTMINKSPKWNEQMQAYCLNFGGRVTKASVKNFQLVAADQQDRNILQFGKVGKDTFTMDYSWPINALQAFAICLTSFDNKLACE